jgi:DNA invertase Pin-like site-specific DNA recombinase
MEENFCALAISILKDCTPEQAFDLYYDGFTKLDRSAIKEETMDMVALKAQGMTYAQIAEIFGMKWATVGKRLKRAEKTACTGY